MHQMISCGSALAPPCFDSIDDFPMRACLAFCLEYNRVCGSILDNMNCGDVDSFGIPLFPEGSFEYVTLELRQTEPCSSIETLSDLYGLKYVPPKVARSHVAKVYDVVSYIILSFTAFAIIVGLIQKSRLKTKTLFSLYATTVFIFLQMSVLIFYILSQFGI